MQYISKAALFASAAVVGGCTNLFEAGFENDLPGRAPGADQSAWTDGDVLISPGSKNVFVTSEHGIAGRKALAFMETALEENAGPFESSFRSAPISDLERPVVLSWHGKFGNGGVLQITTGLSGQTYVKLECHGGDILLDGDVVASYLPGDNHQIEITFAPEDQSFQVSLDGMGVGGPITLQGKAGAGEVMPTPRVFANFRVLPSGKEQLVYILDDVAVKQSPNM